jgi:hypothetical protein
MAIQPPICESRWAACFLHLAFSGNSPVRLPLRGLRGQFVFVDPDLKLVLVQTALSGGRPEAAELFALWNALRAQVH